MKKQLRKEGRKNEYEMLKLQALNQRQKMVQLHEVVMTVTLGYLDLICFHYQVLQRKTEEAALAARRLKELLESRKSCSKETAYAGMNQIISMVKIQNMINV